MDPDEGCNSATTSLQNIREGKAEILVHETDRIFYNPVQEFNRDLSIQVLTTFIKHRRSVKRIRKRSVLGKVISDQIQEGSSQPDKVRVLEALSATGLRSIRFALEVPDIGEIVANDLSLNAVESIAANVKHNKVEHIIKTSHNDASLTMYLSKAEGKLFDVVDLDPYGCPSRFLDATVQVLEDGGLMMVTATDMAVLAGNSPETCYSKYGSLSLRSSACHEMALRILLQCIESHANRYGRYIVPLLSISADFYIRIFAQIFSSPATCKKTTSKLSLAFQCVGCKTFKLHPLGCVIEREEMPPAFKLPRLSTDVSLCLHCKHEYQVGGPIWSAPIHDRKFLAELLLSLENPTHTPITLKRIQGMTTLALNELETPLYYSVDALCSVVHCEVMPLIDFRSALLNAGYDVSESHAAPNTVKTNAPTSMIWDLIRKWVEDGHPVSQKRIDASIVTKNILNSNSDLDHVKFDYHVDAEIQTYGMLRFQINPQANWGPGVRSTNNLVGDGGSKVIKRKMKQNKKKKAVSAKETNTESKK